MGVRLVPYKTATTVDVSYYASIVEKEIQRFSKSLNDQANLASKDAQATLALLIVEALHKHRGVK